MHPRDYRAQYAEEVERERPSRAEQVAGDRGVSELVTIIGDR